MSEALLWVAVAILGLWCGRLAWRLNGVTLDYDEVKRQARYVYDNRYEWVTQTGLRDFLREREYVYKHNFDDIATVLSDLMKYDVAQRWAVSKGETHGEFRFLPRLLVKDCSAPVPKAAPGFEEAGS